MLEIKNKCFKCHWFKELRIANNPATSKLDFVVTCNIKKENALQVICLPFDSASESERIFSSSSLIRDCKSFKLKQ